MNRLARIVFATFFLFAAQASFACDYPERTKIPDGNTASKEEMLSGQKGVKEFVAAMEAYLDCLVAEEKTARSEMEDLEPEDEQLREDLLNKKYNAAVEDMQKVAAQFNEEVQAYKAQKQ